jgi:hypothetical protein
MNTSEPITRRFGPYPANRYDGSGIPTAKAAYLTGYETGRTWPWDHNPGGPFVCVYRSGDHQDWKEFCEAMAENRAEWLRGWHDGRKGVAICPPELNVDHIAILGYN